jgi:hypothetical protein
MEKKLNNGDLKNLVVFQILSQTYFIRKFTSCCICTVNSDLDGMTFNCILVWGPEMS